MIRILLTLLLFLLPSPVFALAGDWTRDDAVAVRLISGPDSVASDAGSVSLGIDIKLNEGWHTYWRSPGMAGLPPQLDWSRSQTDDGNLQNATLSYPAPSRYSAYGLETIGYRDHVVFPVEAALRKPGQPLKADLSLDLLVCSSVCVPKHFDLKLMLPTGTGTNGAEAAILQAARDHLPTDGDHAGLLIGSIVNDGQSLRIALSSRERLNNPDLFIEDDRHIGFGAPAVQIAASGHDATLTLRPVDTLPPGVALAGMPVTATLVNGDQATEVQLTLPALSTAPAVTTQAEIPFALAILFAVLGGLILNLMPCVLPVLSLKILGVVGHGGGTARAVRQSFIVTAAGIVFSFLVLAGGTLGLKQFGVALGWGVQFQQPFFLMFLVLLLVLFAANLWDLFDIPLPRFLADRMDTAYHPKLAGDFATGAFATLLATPCSAPFLGTAVGFALASDSAATILAIFAGLGGGMALPYLTVAAFPRLASRLPKPGAWMLRLRHLLGAALGLTALWLVWVLAAQITVAYATAFGLIMAGLVILLALKKRGIKRGLILLGLAEFCIVGLILGFNGRLEPRQAAEMDRQWLAYNQNALDADIAEGKTVFLDVTADWCLTCKANMKFTLSRDEIAEKLFHSDIVAMQADWTNPDPAITDMLHKYGRYGIPFNIVYGPGAPQGVVLPELLTPQMVLKALEKATRPRSE